jgi:hypothetical protein
VKNLVVVREKTRRASSAAKQYGFVEEDLSDIKK